MFAVALLGAFAKAESYIYNQFFMPSGEEYQCKALDKCEDGQYWNYLACECFSMGQCLKLCSEEGQELVPTEMCMCVPKEEIRALYPEWATED